MTQSLVRNITSISILRRILVTLLTPAKHYINHIYYLRIAPLYHTAFGPKNKAITIIVKIIYSKLTFMKYYSIMLLAGWV